MKSDQTDSLNDCLSYIQEDFSEKEITKIVDHVYATQTDSHNTYPFKAI